MCGKAQRIARSVPQYRPLLFYLYLQSSTVQNKHQRSGKYIFVCQVAARLFFASTCQGATLWRRAGYTLGFATHFQFETISCGTNQLNCNARILSNGRKSLYIAVLTEYILCLSQTQTWYTRTVSTKNVNFAVFASYTGTLVSVQFLTYFQQQYLDLMS